MVRSADVGAIAGRIALLFAVLITAAFVTSVCVAQAQLSTPRDPFDIPPDIRAWTPAEERRDRDLYVDASARESRGDSAGAETLWRQAIANREASWGPNHPLTAMLLINLSGALDAQGRLTDAEPHIRRGLTINERRLGAEHPDVAIVLNRLAINLAEQLRYTEAVREAERALLIRERSLGPSHAYTAISALTLGNILHAQGRYADADTALRRALAIQQAARDLDPIAIAESISAIAKNSNAMGQHVQAEALYRRVLEILSVGPDADRARIAGALSDLAATIGYQERYAEAEPLLRRALDLSESELGRESPLSITILSNYAQNLQSQGQCPRAELFARRVVSYREANFGPNDLRTASSLGNLATNLACQERYSEAVEPGRRAADIHQRRLGSSHSSTILAQHNLAQLYARLGRFDQARTVLQSTVVSDISDAHPALSRAYASLALLELRSGQIDAAIDHARTGLRLAEQAPAAPAAGWANASIFDRADEREAARIFARAAFLGQATRSDAAQLRAEAFEAIQVFRPSSTRAALARGAARSAANQAGFGGWVSALENAEARIRDADRRMAALRASNDPQWTSLVAFRAMADAQRRAALRELSEQFPEFFALLNGRSIPLSEIQAQSGSNAALLRDDEALILLLPGSMEMPAGHRRGFVFVVTKDHTAWAELGLEPDALAREIEALRGDLDIYANARAFTPAPQGARSMAQPRFDRARAHALYQALFGDPAIAALLATKENWLIAPQAGLLSLPFAALVTETPMGGPAGDTDVAQLRSTHWLGLERTLSILPAVSSLATLRRDLPARPRTDQIAFFGIGDPVFAGAPGAASAPANALIAREGGAEMVRRLPRLPGTRAEIEAMRASLNGDAQDVLLGNQASESNLRAARQRLARARVVTFATHGLLAGDLELSEPALALTPPEIGAQRPDDPRAVAADDGLLTASEAAFLPLSAEWVILSACNTAAGDGGAEGLSGLARAFFYAGARALLVSQWRVRDDAAARLTTRAIVLERSDGLSKAGALRAAMRELLADESQDATGYSFAHPGAWAPFIFVGAS